MRNCLRKKDFCSYNKSYFLITLRMNKASIDEVSFNEVVPDQQCYLITINGVTLALSDISIMYKYERLDRAFKSIVIMNKNGNEIRIEFCAAISIGDGERRRAQKIKSFELFFNSEFDRLKNAWGAYEAAMSSRVVAKATQFIAERVIGAMFSRRKES